MRVSVRALLLFAVFAVPAAAFAQATIAGTVKDASGAVLPGVGVEAASPVLTEKVRTVVTDGSGQYRVVNLPPGRYTVTFALPGFNRVVREGVVLTGSLTATVDVELRIGAIEESVTVSAESPIVDVQSARREQVIDGEVLQAIPTNRSYNSVLQLVPGVVQGNGQVQLRPGLAMFSAHGGSAEDGRLTLDGINVGSSRGGAGVSSYVADMQNISEVAFSISGNLGEAETGGPQMTIVPKTGGNTFSGSAFFTGVNQRMQGSNFDDDLRRVLTVPGKVLKLWDYQAAIGGPVQRDRLWFFFNWREVGGADAVPGIFANKAAGDPTRWDYEADLTRQGRNDLVQRVYALRLTTQLTQKNRLTAFWDEQPLCGGSSWSGDDGCFTNKEGWIQGGNQNSLFLGGPNAPETGDYIDRVQRVQQAKWTSPMTSRILLESGWGLYQSKWGYDLQPGNPTMSLIRVQDNGGVQLQPGAPFTLAGLRYRSSNWPFGKNSAHTWNASASYVTGSHNMKFGYQGAFLRSYGNPFNVINNAHRLTYIFNRGVPQQLTMQVGPWQQKARVRQDAFYAQEQWTRGQLTLQGALRFDYARSDFPEQRIGQDRFVPTTIVFPEAEGVKGYTDLSVRLGAAYDVFGTGRTALKINIGKYMHPASVENRYTGPNPSERVSTITNRSWEDRDRDYEPDCDLLNPALNGECGPWADPNFGRNRAVTSYDPALLEGWGVRPHDWQFGVSVQQQLLPRVSAEVGYYRRSWFAFRDVTDNLLVSAANFDPYSIDVPVDPRLPNGGGYQVTGLLNITPSLFSASDNMVRSTAAFGDYTRYWDGVDVTLTARLRGGLTLQGGTSTGRTVEDICDIRAQVPEVNIGGLASPTNPYCRTEEPFLTQVKGIGSYLVPKIDVQVSGTFSSRPGPSLSATRIVPREEIAQTLGRLPSGNVQSITINMLAPNTLFGERINQLDLRIGKILRFNRLRTNLALDLVNALNSNAILSYNALFGPTWPTPTSVLTARLARVSAEFNW